MSKHLNAPTSDQAHDGAAAGPGGALTNIIPFPTQKLIQNIVVPTPDYAQQKAISWDERLTAAQDTRDRMAVVTEWLERIHQRLADH